jgi:hypothetical protein
MAVPDPGSSASLPPHPHHRRTHVTLLLYSAQQILAGEPGGLAGGAPARPVGRFRTQQPQRQLGLQVLPAAAAAAGTAAVPASVPASASLPSGRESLLGRGPPTPPQRVSGNPAGLLPTFRSSTVQTIGGGAGGAPLVALPPHGVPSRGVRLKVCIVLPPYVLLYPRVLHRPSRSAIFCSSFRPSSHSAYSY